MVQNQVREKQKKIGTTTKRMREREREMKDRKNKPDVLFPGERNPR